MHSAQNRPVVGHGLTAVVAACATASSLFVGASCGSSGTVHVYRFAIHALDVAMLPGLSANATPAQVNTAVNMHSLGSAVLTGQSDARMQ